MWRKKSKKSWGPWTRSRGRRWAAVEWSFFSICRSSPALHRRSSTSNHQALNSHRQETTAVIHNWIEKVGSPAEIKNIEGSTVLKKVLIQIPNSNENQCFKNLYFPIKIGFQKLGKNKIAMQSTILWKAWNYYWKQEGTERHLWE